MNIYLYNVQLLILVLLLVLVRLLIHLLDEHLHVGLLILVHLLLQFPPQPSCLAWRSFNRYIFGKFNLIII